MTGDLERYRGRWIAIDPGDDAVVAATGTLEDLHGLLDSNPERTVVIQRVPGSDEPLFVGLG